MFYHDFCEEIPPNVQPELSMSQLETVFPLLSLVAWEKRLTPHLAKTSVQVESDKVLIFYGPWSSLDILHNH